MKSIIRNFIAKRVAGRSDDGIMITLTDPKKVDFQAAMLEDLLMRNGFNPADITSEKQLLNIINQIKAIEIQAIRNTDVSGIRGTTSAKIFDLEGKEIPKGSKIMGGKAIDDDLPPPGSRGGDDDIAAPVQSQEETMKNMMEAEIKAKLKKQNKDSVSRILERKNREDVYGLEDYDTTNMSEIKKEIIRTETKLGNLNPDDPNFRAKAKPLVDKIEALKNKMRDEKAYGGRIGLKGGADAATASFSKSAGSSRPGRKGSVSISPSGNVTFNPGGKDDPVDDRSTFEQTVNQLRPPRKQPSALEKIFDAGQEFNYLRNLAIGNFPGIGKQLLLDYGKRKLLDDQAMLDTEEDITLAGIDSSVLRDSPYKNVNSQFMATGGRVGFVKGTGLRFLQKVFGKEKFKEMATRDPEMYQGLLEVVDMYRKRDKEGLKMYLQKFLPHMDDEAIEDFIIGSDGSEGLVGELIRLGSGRDYKGKLEMIKRSEEMGKLRDLEVTDEMIRKPNADGGIMRLGFKDGMNRRTFLKLLGGAMSIPIIGKIFKPFKVGKTVTKVPIIKTDNLPGKPEWFDQLVNKVIIEGDEVTKRFATKDREIVHMKKIDDDNTVMVYQDLDEGAVRVDYDAPSNMGEDTVSLQYKKPNPDEGDPRPKAEFEATELEPRYVGGPEDADIEFDGLGGGSSIKMLESDVSKLKEYATGQKQTLKEFIESKKRKDAVKRINEDTMEQAEYIAGKYGDGPEPPDDIDFEDFARGGIARMLGE